MNRIVRPVRAWADYDEWSVYLEEYNDEWHNVLVPKGGGDGWFCEFAVYTGVVDFVRSIQRPIDTPLRSLRVLYENGYELALQKYAIINGLDPEKRHWHWYLKGVDCAGDLAEDTDSEAVERAMIAAAAYFTQAEGLG